MAAPFRPEDEYPHQPAASKPRPKRRKRPRSPSLLEAIKEEEQLFKAGVFDQPLKKPRRQPSAKRDALLKNAKRFAQRALEKSTVKWHKSCG